jgi:hypothetical protein
MKEKQIPFSGAMVRAILAGTKTQTRRVVDRDLWECLEDGVPSDQQHIETDDTPMGGVPATRFCKYGQKGDRLWVRETWRTDAGLDHLKPSLFEGYSVKYLADGHVRVRRENAVIPDGFWGKTRPSIFMPRWASRISLEVTGVRVERVQEITEKDILAEGYPHGLGYRNHDGEPHPGGSLKWYSTLWNEINVDRGYGWDVNPWVWVVEFKRV